MEHIPVLKNEIVESFGYLKNVKDGYFVDGTIGNAGHSISIMQNLKLKTQNDNLKLKIIGIDKDSAAIELSTDNIKAAGLYENFILINDDFKNVKEILNNICHSEEVKTTEESSNDGILHCVQNDNDKINGALIDLGVSSMQLDQKKRGFSFSDPDTELDMRMDQSKQLDAKAILNHYPEERLEKILRKYGEEKFSRRIARNICSVRRNKHIETVRDLLYILEKSIPVKIQKTGKTHFATKTFQALRIEVNGELAGLNEAIKDFVDLLKTGGRFAIITFHSLEDRIVKNTFKEMASTCSCPPKAPVCICDKKASIRLVNRKPIIATEEEIKINPRSRSAKLRIVEKF